MARVRAVNRHVKDRTGKLAVVVRASPIAHQLIVADQDHMLIDGGGNAMAGFLCHIGDARRINGAGIRFLERNRDGMIGIRLGMGRHGKEEVGIDSGFGVNGDDVEGTLGKCAGFVEHHGIHLRKSLKVIRPLHQDAHARCAADAAEERQGHADDESARTAHDEKRKAAQNPIAPRTEPDKRREHGQRKSCGADNRGVDAGESRDEVFGASLLLAGVLDQFEDAADRRIAERLGGANAKNAGHVHAAGNHFGARLDEARNGFPGQGGRIKLARTRFDDAVDRDALARLDDDHIADGNLIGIHLPQLPIAFDGRVIGRDVHHVGNGLAALSDGVALKQLAHLVEQHDRRTLGHMRIGIRESDHRKCADGRHRHEEILVESRAAANVAPRFAEDIVAGDDVGHQVQAEARVECIRISARHRKGAGLVEDHHDEEQGKGDQDAKEQPLLFLVHVFSFGSEIGQD